MKTRLAVIGAILMSFAASIAVADKVVLDRQFTLAKNNPVYVPLPNPPDRSVLGLLNSEGFYLCTAICNLDLNQSVNQNHSRADANFLAATQPRLPTTVMTSRYQGQSWDAGNVTYEVVVDLIGVQFHSVNYSRQFTPTVRVRIVQK